MGNSGPISRTNTKIKTMQNANITKTATPDLLSSILDIQIRNEDKITQQDRIYCQKQQDELYKALDQIDKWYAIFKEDAEQYREKFKFKYEENGKTTYKNYNTYHHYNNESYSHHEFVPFDCINDLVDKNYSANKAFANRIIDYFNNTYNVSVPVPSIDEKTLPMGFRPVYDTYVDAVIEHLGGKSFRDIAEEELINRFLQIVTPSCWSKVKPELKKDKITFPDIVRWNNIHLEFHHEYEFEYGSRQKVDMFCEGIAFGADDVLCGDIGMIVGLQERDVDISGWYNLTTINAEQIKFYKNGRIDVRFKDVMAAQSCFNRLRLGAIRVRDEN